MLSEKEFENLSIKFNDNFDHSPISGRRSELLYEDIKNYDYKSFKMSLDSILFSFNKWDGFSMTDIANLTRKYSIENAKGLE